MAVYATSDKRKSKKGFCFFCWLFRINVIILIIHPWICDDLTLEFPEVGMLIFTALFAAIEAVANKHGGIVPMPEKED
ncbi:hypothetical protein JXH92_003663 [Salmonella enterica subsp. enterica serovar 4,[5],12:b:-]|nr:hypothetical protein [Salmonella enterica subsp. enterica serovar 4,[5],12:b:-]